MSERVFYRDDEAFNAAFDKAVERIDSKRRFGTIDAVVWYGLWAALIVLYGTGWGLGWRLYAVVPGVDLRILLWVILAAWFAFYHRRARHRHAFILRGRLCLECGQKLLDVETDEHGDGACPSCGRGFNLGEYRRPSDRRGAGFRGYLDADHFDKAMYAAGERIKRRSGLGLEGELLGGAWVALGVAFGANLLFDWNPFSAWPVDRLPFWVALSAMFVWSGWYGARIKRMVPSIVEQRRCLECGYSLLKTPTEDGRGRCPECGSVFAEGEYERPAA